MTFQNASFMMDLRSDKTLSHLGRRVDLWQDKSKDLKDPRALEAKKTKGFLNFRG